MDLAVVSPEQLAELAQCELIAAGRRATLLTSMAPADVMVILSGLQLALRHPALPDPTAQHMRNIAEELARLFGQLGPACTEIARRGWDGAYDTNVEW